LVREIKKVFEKYICTDFHLKPMLSPPSPPILGGTRFRFKSPRIERFRELDSSNLSKPPRIVGFRELDKSKLNSSNPPELGDLGGYTH
jgi:hypothetical protein